MIEAAAEKDTTAAPETLYALLADGSTWPAWAAPMKTFRLERESPGGGEGVGAVRVWNSGIRIAVEETTVADPPRRFGYKLLRSPLTQVRDYEALVEITPRTDGGSHLRWSSTFRPLLPGTGWLWRGIMNRIYELFLKNLTAHAESSDARS